MGSAAGIQQVSRHIAVLYVWNVRGWIWRWLMEGDFMGTAKEPKVREEVREEREPRRGRGMREGGREGGRGREREEEGRDGNGRLFWEG